MVVFVGKEIQVLVETASDLNLIQKDIADHLRLRLLFLVRAATQAGGIPLKTDSGFNDWLHITDSFSTHLNLR